MSDTDECVHGMDPVGCADCRGIGPLIEPDPAERAYLFAAVYGGTCAACGDRWTPGTKISRSTYGSGGYNCTACSPRGRT